MGNLLWPLKSRVRMAFLSALAIALISAFVSLTPAAKQGVALVSTALGNPAATATPTSGGQGTGGLAATSSATATPRPSPTTPPATATPTTARPTQPAGSGQFTDLHGTISNIDYDAQTFLCTPQGGAAVLVTVKAGTTQYQGAATTFDGLKNTWIVEASGYYKQADGSFLAYVIQSDDGA